MPQKRAQSVTPQLRSRELLAEQGYLVATIESKKEFPDKEEKRCPACNHQPMIRIKQDLYGCFDLLCEHPQKRERVYVQVTAGTHHTDRMKKILASFEAKLVLMAGARILVHTWNKDDDLNRWTIREEEITLKHFAQAFAYPNTVAELREIRRKEKKDDLPPGTSLPFSPILDEEIPF
jgi:hypothetical protein